MSSFASKARAPSLKAGATTPTRSIARVEAFYPSLYLSMGYACEQLDDRAEAQRYYDLAAALGYAHRDGATAQVRGSGAARQTVV